MVEGFIGSFDKRIEVFSAGTNPSKEVHPLAVKVMMEKGVNISKNYPKHTDRFVNTNFDYVITVCGDADENCPVFSGIVKNRIHIGFDDPAKVEGSDEFVIGEFRRIRDEIELQFRKFYDEQLKSRLIDK